jgi:hypothetical protein
MYGGLELTDDAKLVRASREKSRDPENNMVMNSAAQFEFDKMCLWIERKRAERAHVLYPRKSKPLTSPLLAGTCFPCLLLIYQA